MKRVFSLLLCLLYSQFLIAAEKSGAEIQPDNLFPRVQIETVAGKIVVELDRSRAPITTNNFLAYVASGHYDNTIFHRIITDFVVQGGGYETDFTERKLRDPIYNESGNGLKNEIYSIAMARDNDPHSAASQFYFNMADNTNLDPGKNWGYTVFGMVMEGTEVLDIIAKAPTDFNADVGWEDVPTRPVLLKKATILPDE